MTTPLRLLHVEDQERDAALIARHLARAGYDLRVSRVETSAAMKAALEEGDWDVILCDFSMPHFNALAALALLKELERDIPFIIISGTVGETMAVEAMRAGANDYLMKDNLVRLGATIERELHEAENRRARRQAEEALSKSQTQYRRLLDTTYEGVWVCDAELRTTYVNKRLAEMLRVKAEEMVGRSAMDFLDPYARADIQPRWQRWRQGMKEQYDLQLLLADGSHIWVIVCATPIFNDEREFVGSLSMLTDITERKRAEVALHETARSKAESLALLDTILSTAPIGFAFHNTRLEYERINESLAAINGLPIEQHMGRTLSEVLPEMAPALEPLLRGVLETAEPVIDHELSGETRADPGRQRYWLASFYPVRMQSGEMLGVGVLVSDITERKQLEEQLRQSQKMEAVGQLAGGIAHDFNNLLTAINGYSSLALQRLDADHPIKGYLEEIKKAGDRAANLTRQLLAFGRKQILQPLAIDLNDVVADMNKMLRRLIGEDIQLNAKFDPQVKRVTADPGQIEQVLVNLVVNARDAMPQGGNLTIETANVELDRGYAGRHVGVKAGAYVMLAVSDTGVGIDEQTQARIFEPFFTTKEKGKGTGLGLSTVYGIVKQSGGNIWVYSEPGHGTTFKVYLPALDHSAKQPEAKAVESLAPGGAETVLLVEDEDVVRNLARQILQQAGYNVIEASRGEEAVRLGSEAAQAIHLLLTDVVMPGISGKQVAERLSAMRPDIKVLFMSGYTDEAIVHHGILDSTVEFIQKPFTPAALVRKVRKVLDNGQATINSGSLLPLGEGLGKRE